MRPRLQPARWDVDDDARLALAPLHDPVVERPRHERDRPVPARRRVAGIVEEDDAEVGAVVVRRDDMAAVHVRVTARLVDEQPPHVVEPLERIATLLEDRRAAQRLDAARDDPERLAAGVVVDGLDPHGRDCPCVSTGRRRGHRACGVVAGLLGRDIRGAADAGLALRELTRGLRGDGPAALATYRRRLVGAR
jgi:hypothetical protein